MTRSIERASLGFRLSLAALTGAWLVASPAPAQEGGYTIQKPGELTRTVTPDYTGGYTVHTPGEPSTSIRPDHTGGYDVQTPGIPPIFVPLD